MNKEKKVGLALIVFSLVLYIALDAPYPTLLLIVLILTLVLAKIVSIKAKKTVSIAVKGEMDFEKNDLIQVNIVIKNHKFFPVFNGKVKLVAENVLTDERYAIERPFSLGMKKESVFPLEIRGKHCGCINFFLEDFYVADPFLLFKERVDCKINKEIFILPRLRDMKAGKKQVEAYDMESYRYSSTRKGDDSSETFGIADYLEGDPVKAIHWKLSSKLGDLMVREYSHPIDNKLMIILDKNIPRALEIPPEERDRATELLLSLSSAILKQGIDHQIAWQNYRTNTFESKKIAREEDLWEAITMLLNAPYRESNLSTVKRYIGSDLEKNYSKYLYLGSGREDLDLLKEYGEVDVYDPKSFQ